MKNNDLVSKYNGVVVTCALLLGVIIGIMIANMFFPTTKIIIDVPEKGNYTFDIGDNILEMQKNQKCDCTKFPNYRTFNISYNLSSTIMSNCCYPVECEGLYSNEDCNHNCIYPVYCFKEGD